MKKISQLRFGGLDAKRYLDDPSDPLSIQFKKSFLKSRHLEKVLSPETFFLIGDKGMGKTAYAVYSSTCIDDYLASTTFFNESNFTRMREIATEVGISSAQYSSIWSFVLSVVFIENFHSKTDKTEDLKFNSIITCIRTCNLGGKVDTISKAIELILSLDQMLEELDRELDLDLPNNAIKNSTTAVKLARLTDICMNALSTMSNTHQFTVFLDGLDVRPDRVQYSDFLEVISSICNAVWLINSSQFSKAPHMFKLVLLLRPDMFENVTFQNRGPILQDHSHLIEWNTPYNSFEDSEIFKLTDRILYSQQKTEDINRTYPGDVWRHYFPFRVHSRFMKEGDDPFILVLRHSFTKPRDIVKYLSLMSDRYHSENLENETQFKESDFNDKKTRKEFSSYLNQEIRDHLSFYYTNNEYQSFLDFNSQFLRKKINSRTRVVNYDNFVAAHKEYMTYNRLNKIDVPGSFETADLLLQFMFDLNVLGYYEEVTFRDGNKRVFTNYSYKRRNFANLRPKVPTDGRYVMHYGVARALFVDLL